MFSTALVAVALLTAGCGSDDDDGTSVAGNSTDAGFITDMTAHHRSAIEMAEVAQQRAEDPRVRKLATDVMRAQRGEIAVMGRIGADMRSMGMGGGGGGMPMSRSEMGMDTDMPMLRRATLFDRAFMAAMIPHHEGAVRMARRHLAKGRQPALRTMSRDILETQGREIEQMRKWCGSGCGA